MSLDEKEGSPIWWRLGWNIKCVQSVKVTLRGFIVGIEGSKDDQREEQKRGTEEGGRVWNI